jgi:hypothetical protein
MKTAGWLAAWALVVTAGFAQLSYDHSRARPGCGVMASPQRGCFGETGPSTKSVRQPSTTPARRGASLAVRADLPLATDIDAIEVSPRTPEGTEHNPYNAVDPLTGGQFFSIASIRVNDAGATRDIHAAFLRLTAQDYDSEGNAIGPEQPFAGQSVSADGTTWTYGPLMGNYLSSGWRYERRGNAAEVGIRVYLLNREASPMSFQDPECATLQTRVGTNGLAKIKVAAAGLPPLGKLVLGAGNKSGDARSLLILSAAITPTMGVSSLSTFVYTIGGPPPSTQTLTVTSFGSQFDFSASPSDPWLEVNPRSGTTPG